MKQFRKGLTGILLGLCMFGLTACSRNDNTTTETNQTTTESTTMRKETNSTTTEKKNGNVETDVRDNHTEDGVIEDIKEGAKDIKDDIEGNTNHTEDGTNRETVR